MATPIDVVMLKCRKFFRTGNRWNHALFTGTKKTTKFRLPHKLSLLRGSGSKSARVSPRPPTFGSQCSKFHSNRFTFGGVIVERAKAVHLAHDSPVFSWIMNNDIIPRLLCCFAFQSHTQAHTLRQCSIW